MCSSFQLSHPCRAYHWMAVDHLHHTILSKALQIELPRLRKFSSCFSSVTCSQPIFGCLIQVISPLYPTDKYYTLGITHYENRIRYSPSYLHAVGSAV